MRPLIISCSQRTKPLLDDFVPFLEKRGVTVLYPNFKHHRKSMIVKSEVERLESRSYELKIPGMVRAHFKRIKEAKSLGGIGLIFNPVPGHGQKAPNGYIGSNTSGEIGAMEVLDMIVLFLRPHEERWIMEVAQYPPDKRRIFTLFCPKDDPTDWDSVWNKWLKGWLNG